MSNIYSPVLDSNGKELHDGDKVIGTRFTNWCKNKTKTLSGYIVWDAAIGALKFDYTNGEVHRQAYLEIFRDTKNKLRIEKMT